MSTVKLTPGRLGVIMRKAHRKNKKAVVKGMERAKQRAVALLKMKTPVDTGLMREGWMATKDGVVNTHPVAGVIERGARPHAVSKEGIEAIREWVIRKGIIQFEGKIGPAPAGKRNSTYGRSVSLTRSEAEGEGAHLVDAVVWGIVNRLKQFGYPGTHYVESSLPELSRFLDDEVNKAIAEAVANPEAD